MRLLRFARNDIEEEKDTKRGQSPFLRNDIEEEKILRRIPLEILALSFVIALASLLFFSPLNAVFVLGGGAFSALSFVWLKKSVSRLFLLKKALLSGLALYALRLLLILAVFFIIILLFSKKIIAFAVGFSVLTPVFLAEAVIALSRMKQWKG